MQLLREVNIENGIRCAWISKIETKNIGRMESMIIKYRDVDDPDFINRPSLELIILDPFSGHRKTIHQA